MEGEALYTEAPALCNGQQSSRSYAAAVCQPPAAAALGLQPGLQHSLLVRQCLGHGHGWPQDVAVLVDVGQDEQPRAGGDAHLLRIRKTKVEGRSCMLASGASML